MKNYLIEFTDNISIDGVYYQGCIMQAYSTAKAALKFRLFCEKNNLAIHIKRIREVKETEIILIKAKCEYLSEYLLNGN